MADILVEIWQLARDEEGHDVVLLRDAQGRILPIVIGPCEAAAIWVCLEPDLSYPYMRRPWSHDLIQSMLERFDAHLERVVIDDLSKGTFYATLHIQYHGREEVVDSRPSDALALILRMPASLFVNSEVMDEASITPGSGTEEHGEEI